MSQTRTVFKAVVFSLAGLVLVVVGVGLLLARDWQVETVRVLRAPPALVEALIRDLRNWEKWSAIEVDLGPQTARKVVGEAGPGQRVEWSGPLGKAVLTATAVSASALDYTIGVTGEDAPSPVRGHLDWQADGAGCRVRWVDEGSFANLLLRWFGWFGALQERIKQIHASGLSELQAQVETPPGAGK
ncbi:MAG: SRPBCC family protein [Pirellulales bacterium]